MIEVQNLSKRYPTRLAVDDVTFSVREGEIVGFLGPNGAGFTTMRCWDRFCRRRRPAGWPARRGPAVARAALGYPESAVRIPACRRVPVARA
jgi:ABC-2 type transport system ATP-binding protein